MKSSFAISPNVSLKSFRICFVFQKYDIALWVKELLNVAHSIFVVSTIQLNCNQLETFALGQNLKNWKIGKEKFGNAKILYVFNVYCLVISRLLGQGGSN